MESSSLSAASSSTSVREVYSRSARVKMHGQSREEKWNAAAVQFTTLTSAQAYVNNGRVRVLAVCGPRRIELLPAVPTMTEAGVPKFEIAIWNGLLVPARTPRAIIDRLHADVIAVMGQSEVRSRIVGTGSEPVGSTPEAFEDYIRSEIASWGEIVRKSGAKVWN